MNVRKFALYQKQKSSGLRDLQGLQIISPANIYLFKVNNRNTKKGVKYVQI